MDPSQVNKMFSNYLIIIFMTEQRKRIIGALDYLISESEAA
jgi:RNA binding exosome subunit